MSCLVGKMVPSFGDSGRVGWLRDGQGRGCGQEEGVYLP